jgi:anti-sigma regulatory factor (Ser/Thr protein kinase)
MGAREFEVRLPAVPASPAAARDAVERSLNTVLSPGKLDEARIAVSELVSNAVQHANLAPEDSIELRGSLDPGMLRVEVRDGGPGFDAAVRRAGQPDSGWGLHILDQLADRWGTSRDRSTGVWFEMDLDLPDTLTG